MTEAPKRRGRKPAAPTVDAGLLTVKVANAIHDGKGGFVPVGAKTKPVDDEARASLIAKGLAE